MLLVCRSFKVQNGGMWITAFLPEKFSSSRRNKLAAPPTHGRGRSFLAESLARRLIRFQIIPTVQTRRKVSARLFRRRRLLPNNGGDGWWEPGRGPSSWTSWQRGRATTRPEEARCSGRDARRMCPYMDDWLVYELTVRLWRALFFFTASIKCKTNLLIP